MTGAWAALAGAIASEVSGTLALRQLARSPTGWTWVIVIVGYLSAFVLLSLALRRLPVGVTYATWSAVGSAVVALGGVVLFRERLTITAILGLADIIIGVVILNLSTTHG